MAELPGPGGVDALETVAVGNGIEDTQEKREGIGKCAVEVEEGEAVGHGGDDRTDAIERYARNDERLTQLAEQLAEQSPGASSSHGM
ncbi:hypothetical protein [Massilia phyllosphaerae]|uniref:hypothetical protein n=1 Tax=Massilia phyllosphaerae TaxID=3106034 RepID=UPI002B1CAE64|nr:hypothetical protein [Massilia sp. SGZ-792]